MKLRHIISGAMALLMVLMLLPALSLVPTPASADVYATATDLNATGTNIHVHVFPDEFSVVQKPTCTQYGMQVRVCKKCGYTQIVYLDALPHAYGSWKIITEATDHSSGVRERVCSSCGLVDHNAFDPAGTLRLWSQGPAVKEVQKALNSKGYLSSRYVDGDFGPYTEQAIMLFQMDNDLTADGVAWPQTIKVLRLGKDAQSDLSHTDAQDAPATSGGLTDLTQHG